MGLGGILDAKGVVAKGSMDDYKVMKKIGSGSYGAAFLVVHKKENAEYVLKKVRLDNVGAKERAAAFQEVKLLAKLRHPCILRYHAHFTHARSLCLVTNYCAGGDLYEHLKSRKQHIDEDVAIEWLVQLALSLEILHDRKIMHRDLKTQNIFLNSEGTICLGDFGISRVLGSAREMARTVIGTPFYMSPEIMESKPYDYKSDMWALGCVMYEIISLRHAFDANDMNGLVMKIVRGKPVAMPTHYSQDLRQIIGKLLAKSPKHRPTASDLLKIPFLKERVAKWRAMINKMGDRDIVLKTDLDENMARIIQRHKKRQMGNQQEGVPQQAPMHMRHNIVPVADPPAQVRPRRKSLDEAVGIAEHRLKQIQQQRDLVRKQQEQVLKGKEERRRMSGVEQAPPPSQPPAVNSAAVDGNNNNHGNVLRNAARRRVHANHPGQMYERMQNDNNNNNIMQKENIKARADGNPGRNNHKRPSGPTDDQLAAMSPRSRMAAKKEAANRQREWELRAAHMEYFEERKVAEDRRQQEYRPSNENSGGGCHNNNRAPSNPHWYDEDGGEMEVADGVSKHEAASVSGDTFRSGEPSARAMALKEILFEQLGSSLFKALYSAISQYDGGGNEDAFKDQIREWLGPSRMHCVGLVDQLIYYEECAR